MLGRAGAEGSMHRGQFLVPGLRLIQMPLGLTRGDELHMGGKGPFGMQSVPITDTGLVCPGITGGGKGNFCPGWGWHAAPWQHCQVSHSSDV